MRALTFRSRHAKSVSRHMPTVKGTADIMNIGIKHGFSCSNIRQVPREVLKTEAEGRGFQPP